MRLRSTVPWQVCSPPHRLTLSPPHPPASRKNFRFHRERLRLTQEEIAGRFGMPRRTWQNLEGGARETPEWVQRLLLARLASMRPPAG